MAMRTETTSWPESAGARGVIKHVGRAEALVEGGFVLPRS